MPERRKRLYAGTINYHESDGEWENLHLDVVERGIWRRDVGPVNPEFFGDISDPESMAQFPEGFCDEIVCHHVLEHLHPEDVAVALGEFCRILLPGGVLDVEVPDFRKVAAAFLKNDLDHAGAQQWVYGEHLPNHAEADTHRSLHTAQSIGEALYAAGFVDLQRREAGHGARYLAVKPE